MHDSYNTFAAACAESRLPEPRVAFERDGVGAVAAFRRLLKLGPAPRGPLERATTPEGTAQKEVYNGV